MPDEPRLEEQVISQVVQAGLASQLEDAEDVQVDVQTSLGKAVQGEVDSVTLSGQGMVIQDVRVQQVEVQTNRVLINPLSALLGKLELDQPVDAVARVTLTEADLNRAMNSDMIASRIPPLRLWVDKEMVTVELHLPMQIQLPGQGQFCLQGAAQLHKASGSRQVQFSAVIVPGSDDRPLVLEAFQCQPGQGISLEFAIALMQKFKEILSQPYFELEGMALRVKHLDVQAGHLTLETEAHVAQMPSM